MTNTPRLGLQLAELTGEEADVPKVLNRVSTRLDQVAVRGDQGATAATPSARIARSLWFDQTTKVLSWDDGDNLFPILPHLVGAVLNWPWPSAPPAPGTVQWIELLGQSITRANFPELFAAAGVGDTSMVLPNWSGRTPIGAGEATAATSKRTVGQVGGEENHTLVLAELPQHFHAMTSTTGAGTDGSGPGVPPHNSQPSGQLRTTSGVATQSGNPVTVDQGHNTMQPFAVTRYFIRAK
jgi:microcystin-dependent protein